MATPPQFVSENESAFDGTNTSKTVNVAVAPGDLLVIAGATEDPARTLGTPTGGGLTYTLQRSVAVASRCNIYLWTATATAAATVAVVVTIAGTAGQFTYFNVIVWRNHRGLGATAVGNAAAAAPSLALATTAPDSAVVVLNTDWLGADGAARVWRPNPAAPVELNYSTRSTFITLELGYHPDVGAVGTKTVGLTVPASQNYSIIAAEIKGVP